MNDFIMISSTICDATSDTTIQQLRTNLYAMFDKYHGNLQHPRILQASRALDEEILKVVQCCEPQPETSINIPSRRTS